MALPNAPIIKVYYGKPILPEVSRVFACLYEKDFEMVDLQNVEKLPVGLIRLQASTSVPAPFFEDGSKFLFESRAICRYISETYAYRGNRYLLGRDLLDRVSIEQWLKSEEQSFDPPSRALVLHLAFPESPKPNNLREESERLAKVLDVYNHRLGESRYLAGDEFTLADLTHIPNSQYIEMSEDWCHLFHERENVMRWWEEVSARPSWSKVIDDIEILRSNGEEEEEARLPKTSLQESIFLPIETMELPEDTRTITISKNVARPRGSIQVSVPEKRGFLVSAPDKNVARIETMKIQSQPTPHTIQHVTDAKVTMEESYIPPTNEQVSPTDHIDEVRTQPTRVGSQSTKPVTDAKVTMEESYIPPINKQASPTDRIDKVRTEPTRVTFQSTKPVTDAKATIEGSTSAQVPPTDHTGKVSTKPTGAAPDIDKMANVYVDSKRKEWNKQWQNPEKFGEQKHTNSIPAQKPKPPKIEELTPATTLTPTKSSDTTRQDPVNSMSTDAQVKQPSESRTSTKPEDTTPTSIQDPEEESFHGGTNAKPQERAPAADTTQKTTDSAASQLPPPSSNGTAGGITNKTENIPAQSSTANIPTATAEPTTNKPKTLPSTETIKTTVRATEESTQGSTKDISYTGEPKVMWPMDIDIKTSIKIQTPSVTSQIPPISETAARTTDVSKLEKVPDELKEALADTKSDNILAQNSQADTQKASLVPAIEDTYRDSNTDKQKDMPKLAPETETARKDQNLTTEEAAVGTTNVSQLKKVPTKLKEVLAGTKSGNDFAQNFQVDTQKSPPVPATEDISRGSTTDKSKETPQLAAEAKTTIKGKTPPTEEAAAGTTYVSQSKKVPTELKEASAGTKSSNNFAQNSQADTQKSPPVPATEDISRDSTTDKSKETPEQDAEAKKTIKGQTPPTEDAAAGTTDVSQSKKVPTELKETSAGSKSGNDFAQNSQADAQKSPPVPATEDISRDSTTDKSKETPELDAEAKTTIKGQTPPTEEAAAGTTDVSQSKKVPTELKEASVGTKSSNNFAHNSQADAQKSPPVPATEGISRDSTTDKSKETPELDAEAKTTIKGQTPLTEEAAAGTTDVSQSKKIPTELREVSADTESGNDLAQNSHVDTQKIPPVSATEDISRGLSTNKPKEIPKLAEETETTRKGEGAAGATDVSQLKKEPAENKEASAATKLGNDLAQNSQTDTQKVRPVEVATPKSQTSPVAEKQYFIDEAGTEKTKDEVSSRQSPSSTNQKGGELSPDTKSSLKKTDPASDGSSTTLDTTRNQQETQNKTEMGTKTESDQPDTSEPNQTPPQQNKTDYTIPKNETLTEIKQDMSSPQDNEPTPSNKSPPKVPNEENGPGPTNNLEPANK